MYVYVHIYICIYVYLFIYVHTNTHTVGSHCVSHCVEVHNTISLNWLVRSRTEPSLIGLFPDLEIYWVYSASYGDNNTETIICINLYMSYDSMSMCACVCMCVCVCVCMCVCVYTHAYMHANTHTHQHTNTTYVKIEYICTCPLARKYSATVAPVAAATTPRPGSTEDLPPVLLAEHTPRTTTIFSSSGCTTHT